MARARRYFDLFGEYRDGRAAPIVLAFANPSRIAALESLTTAQRLRETPEDWRARLGPVRSRRATHQLLEPPRRVWRASRNTGAVQLETTPLSRSSPPMAQPSSSTHPPQAGTPRIQRLVDAEILIPLTQSKRNQIRGAVDILDELEDLSTRIEIAARLT